MLGGDPLNTQPWMMGTATKNDPTGKNRIRDALDREPDATEADLEATQVENSTKRKRKRRYKGPRLHIEKHVLAGCKDTRARICAAWENATSHSEEKLRIKKNKKNGREDQPPTIQF